MTQRPVHSSMQPSIPAPAPFLRPTRALATVALMAGLTACGGGGDSATPAPPPPPPAPATTALKTTVVDGALEKAVVCLDKNSNGLCDAGEPTATTDAAGNATLNVPNEDLGKYAVLAMVGTDAIDADTGPVKTAFTLKAPADTTALVSPLTTLVETQRANTGSSTTDAAAAVQAQLGLSGSSMADFTQDSSADGKLAATLARLIVVTTQVQRNDTSGALGVDGKPLTTGQIDSVINIRLLQQLQTLATAVQDNPSLADPNTSMADKQASMETTARQVADASGLTAANVGVVAAAQAQTTTPEATTPTETSSLRWFSFTNASNFYIRAFEASAAQNTPDANGKRHFTEYRERVVNGVESPWVRPQVYWTGSSWFSCPTDYVHEVGNIGSTGETESLYCNAMRSRAKQSVRDISGLKMADIVSDIRSSPLLDSADGSFADWGPKPSQLPTNATWPSGSTLAYRTVTDLGGTEYYLGNNTNRATIPPANDPNNPDSNVWHSASLAEFVAWNAGDFASNVSTAQVHGNNARVLVSRRDYLKPDGSSAYKRYMVGFEPGGELRARFYECEGDTSQNRNATLFINGISTCKVILVSNYSISNLGDAKVLRFSAEPTQLNVSNFQNYRLFVERGGVTYLGYRDKQMVSYQQRLNKVAAEALLASLGLN
ncbi:MAG: hypothetical protein RR701_03535 [Comamonas sp.]